MHAHRDYDFDPMNWISGTTKPECQNERKHMFVETTRLILRSMQPSEAGILQQFLQEPDIQLEFKNLIGLNEEVLRQEITARLHGHKHPWCWMVERNTNVVVGFLLIRNYEALRACQVYYALRQCHRGNGYATEAVRSIQDYLHQHEHVQMVFLRGNIQNTDSRNVAIRAGFHVIGRPKNPPAMFFGYTPYGMEPSQFMEKLDQLSEMDPQ